MHKRPFSHCGGCGPPKMWPLVWGDRSAVKEQLLFRRLRDSPQPSIAPVSGTRCLLLVSVGTRHLHGTDTHTGKMCIHVKIHFLKDVNRGWCDCWVTLSASVAALIRVLSLCVRTVSAQQLPLLQAVEHCTCTAQWSAEPWVCSPQTLK